MHAGNDEVADMLADALWRLLEPKSLDAQILALLSGGRRASGNDLARILRRRKIDIHRICRQLAIEDRLSRDGSRWRRKER